MEENANNWGALRHRPLGWGVADPKNKPPPHVRYRVKFDSYAQIEGNPQNWGALGHSLR